MNIKLYTSNTCPKCTVLKKKLGFYGIQFENIEDIETALKEGIDEVPVLEVDGKKMMFSEANDWILKSCISQIAE